METSAIVLCSFLVVMVVGQSTTSDPPIEIPPLEEYAKCYDTLSDMLPWNDCTSSVAASTSCARQLERAVNACPDGKRVEDPYPCHLMNTKLTMKPMYYINNSSVIKVSMPLSMCLIISKLEICTKECSTSFEVPPTRPTDLPCSVQATKSCKASSHRRRSYALNDCSDLTVAKDCYTRALNKCAGTTTEQLAVNLMLIGINNHLEKCEKAKELCSEVDVPDHIPTIDSQITKDNCKMIQLTESNLQSCLYNNTNTTVPEVRVRVQDKIKEFEDPSQKCDKKGFTLKSYKEGGNHAVTLPQPTVTFFILLTFVVTALFH